MKTKRHVRVIFYLWPNLAQRVGEKGGNCEDAEGDV